MHEWPCLSVDRNLLRLGTKDDITSEEPQWKESESKEEKTLGNEGTGVAGPGSSSEQKADVRNEEAEITAEGCQASVTNEMLDEGRKVAMDHLTLATTAFVVTCAAAAYYLHCHTKKKAPKVGRYDSIRFIGPCHQIAKMPMERPPAQPALSGLSAIAAIA